MFVCWIEALGRIGKNEGDHETSAIEEYYLTELPYKLQSTNTLKLRIKSKSKKVQKVTVRNNHEQLSKLKIMLFGEGEVLGGKESWVTTQFYLAATLE